ncbi:MAG: zinc ribbon domain-containing protein [Planctomycetota bacterium]|nr:zinc ribbon domain-containing protein [Planctomycetota bacterium]
MPIYEYSCCDCADDFELLLRSTETAECPACGSQKLEKQLSIPVAHNGASDNGASESLPVCQAPPATGCGAPQCGSGGCMMP